MKSRIKCMNIYIIIYNAINFCNNFENPKKLLNPPVDILY